MKGFMYTLEAMIAALIILSALVTVYSFSRQQENFGSAAIKEKGYSCIKDMDSRGILRHYALSNDSAGIRGYFQGCLPRTLNFSVSFCASCAAGLPGNMTIESVNYLIAGEGATFQPTSISLFLWSLV
jgi:hypothetical protein